MPSFDEDPSVVAAVARDLAALARRDRVLAESALAASAIVLAREMDDENSATSKSMCARALLDTMNRLWELAPPALTEDGVDDLRQSALLKLVPRPAS